MSSVSGMAASIRAITDSDTFDLGGQNVSTITTTIQSAFSEPLPLTEMVRITFVTGAGKLGRQKYDEGAAKAVTSALRDLGFEDDRGASCVNECAGSFKLQHDTGKNLKTVVVFPKIMEIEAGVEGLAIDDGAATESLLEEGSPESLIAMSSTTVFERMVKSKCPSWLQKKGCIAAIESLKTTLEELDAKLLTGTPLTDGEQELYDAVSLDDLGTKEAFVRQEMHAQVEGGSITKQERETLLEQVSERLEKLQKEISESSDKPKKLEKLSTMKEKAEQRKELLTNIAPKAPHKLRHEAEIIKLLTEMAPLQKLEDDSKGRLLSVKETQLMGRKAEIEEQVEELEDKSRGWFEGDDAFEVRVQLTRGAFAAKQKLVKKKKPASSGFKNTVPTRFILPGQKQGGGGTKPKAKKPSKTPGGVFAAMMMDSDSD